MGAQLDPITIDHHNISLPFRVSFGEGLCQQQRVEIALLKGNVGVHDDDVHLMPRSRSNPFHGITRPILGQEAWIPDIRNDTAVLALRPIEDRSILHVLVIVGTRPDLINLSHDMVIKEHGLEVLDGLNVNIDNISEIEFDDLGANGTKIAARSRIHAHTDLDKGMDRHGSRNHFMSADGSVGIQK